MKLVCPDMFPPFQLECDRVNVISVENGRLYYRMANEFAAQCAGREGGFVLSEDNSPLNLSKVAEMITCFIPFELNSKRLLTRLYSKLESICESELYEKTIRLRAEITEYLSSATEMLNCDTEFDNEADLKALFKCFDMKFSSSERLSDQVMDYLLNVYELDGKRLFVTVGLLEFMGRDEADLFFRTVIGHKLTLLMLEGRTPQYNPFINRMTIDEDYCVF